MSTQMRQHYPHSQNALDAAIEHTALAIKSALAVGHPFTSDYKLNQAVFRLTEAQHWLDLMNADDHD